MSRAAMKRILDPRGDVDTKIAEFREFMEAGVPVIIPQGRTEAPLELVEGSRGRQTVILTASREYDENPRMNRMVGKAAFINDSLREQDLGLLTGDERSRFDELTT